MFGAFLKSNSRFQKIDFFLFFMCLKNVLHSKTNKTSFLKIVKLESGQFEIDMCTSKQFIIDF